MCDALDSVAVSRPAARMVPRKHKATTPNGQLLRSISAGDTTVET
jgi:hypothetical protein